jgi:large repetitive protein
MKYLLFACFVVFITSIKAQILDPNAISRDPDYRKKVVPYTKAVGDPLNNLPITDPAITTTWGLGVTSNSYFITDYYHPNTIFEVNFSGTIINSINVSSWVGGWVADLDYDNGYLYALNVGGDNSIRKIQASTGTVVKVVGGTWTANSQRGLAFDAQKDEFYVGGWNDNIIYHLDNNGNILSSFPFSGISGLAWDQHGNNNQGSLWIMTNSDPNNYYEVNPTNGNILKTFLIPGGQAYGGAGLDIKDNGNLCIANQKQYYLCD